jgi:hypothetical protein
VMSETGLNRLTNSSSLVVNQLGENASESAAAAAALSLFLIEGSK